MRFRALLVVLIVFIAGVCRGKPGVPEVYLKRFKGKMPETLPRYEDDGSVMSSVRRLLKSANETVRELNGTMGEPGKEYRELAERIRRRMGSGEFGRMVEGYRRELKKWLIEGNPYVPEGSMSGKSRQYLTGKIYICISSSIPLATLRSYVKAVDAIGTEDVVFVLRGFVEGIKHFKPTLEFVQKLLVKDESRPYGRDNTYRAAIYIDPKTFRKYGIDRVPAFVYEAGNDAYVIYGDVSLKYAVRKFYEETGNEELKALLRLLREGAYAEEKTER